jgi:uncharacterized protein (TIGR01777 family)
MSRIVVSGATGFVGRHLTAELLARGHEVTALTRDPTTASAALPPGVRTERWDVRDASAPIAAIERGDGADAVLHLAGEAAIGSRWNERVKSEIMDSRVKGTERVVAAMERAERRPSVFVSASGVGYYGARGPEPLDETEPAGSDFLARVTIAWEGAAVRAEALGVRVVRTRLGIVLGRGGGALVEMVKPFKLFVGGPIGSGQQMVSWVHIDDVSAIYIHALEDAQLSGPVNVASPHSVPNAELARDIGAVLHRPSAIPVPEFALRVRFGEGADPLVSGQNAVPAALLARGYAFKYPEVKAALADALG